MGTATGAGMFEYSRIVCAADTSSDDDDTDSD
jgi:hypothetical protein